MNIEPVVKAYTIDEHPDPDAVIEWVGCNWHDLHGWGGEYVASLVAFCDYHNIQSLDYSVGLCSHSYARGYAGGDATELSGWQLYTYLRDTGGVAHATVLDAVDEAILQPMNDFMAKPQLMEVTLQELVDQCLQAWVDFYVEDLEYAYSEEGIRETLLGSEHTFLESGEFYE